MVAERCNPTAFLQQIEASLSELLSSRSTLEPVDTHTHFITINFYLNKKINKYKLKKNSIFNRILDFCLKVLIQVKKVKIVFQNKSFRNSLKI